MNFLLPVHALSLDAVEDSAPRAAQTLPKGTKFQVNIQETLFGATPKGSDMTFYSVFSVAKKGVIVPAYTRFTGKVLDSHPPQRAGNGGLLVLVINRMELDGRTYNISAYVTKANDKKIFYNNIKGERGYLQGVIDSTKPGRSFYHTCVRTMTRVTNGPFVVLLSPFILLSGITVLLLNVVGSPVFGLFYKGSEIVVPAGARFEIKLLEDVEL